MSNASSNSNVLTTVTTVLIYGGTSVNEIPLIGRFWMFLISNCASFICSVFVLYYLLFDKNLRRGLNSHVLIVGLIFNLFALVLDVPLVLYHLYHGIVWIQVPIICVLWQYIDSVSYTVLPKLVAWASFERHILIFNEQRLLQSKNRILFHYIPIGVVAGYHILLYTTIYFIVPCHNIFDYTQTYCGYDSCVYETSFTIYELFSNGVFSCVCIAFFNITLIVRVIYRKYRVQGHVDWHKHRKLTLQLLFVVSIFYIFYFPLVIVGVCRYITGIKTFGSQYYVYGSFFSYYVNFLFPFGCVGTIPKLKTKTKKILLCWKIKPSAVGPRTVTNQQQRTGQTPMTAGIA
ncbi:unnamed protein product [Adineta steineri]|uniref:G-protein coupled receptors family 1 profile domain-containing protein n=1 Tax=Adineta steineri TaxID=433720 RepID=A0A819NUD3_9BILA|nr:unnamed protein product [Adineta steineri]